MNEPLPLILESPRRGQPPRHWADLTPAQRREYVEAAGHRAFRARQLSSHYFEGLRTDPSEWTDLPETVRASLAAAFMPALLKEVRTQTADGGDTVKTLWRLFDNALVESVLMRYPDRVTMCVSSQAGCGMACPFCATGQGGLQRNLSQGEIVEQVVDGARRLRRGDVEGDRVSNVVFMGMGEPMANYKAVIGAVRQLVAPSPRRPGDERPRHHRVHRRAGAEDAAAGDRGHPGDPGAVPARPRRRAP